MSTDQYFRCRILRPKVIGNYEISIQASFMHFCEPRLTSNDLSIYKSFEVSLYYKSEIFNPKFNKLFKNLAWVKYWDDMPYGLGSYVPKRDVDSIIFAVKKIQNEI